MQKVRGSCSPAVAKLLKQDIDLEYRIVGEGELRPHLEQLIRELGVGDRVHLLGVKHQSEIVEFLNQVHIFVAPSVTSRSGDQDAPINTLKEAMATGLPVVSTWHGGIPELVDDGVSGFLVPEKDPEAITDKLAYLIHHPELWPTMGLAGRKRVLADYEINRINDELVVLYENLLQA